MDSRYGTLGTAVDRLDTELRLHPPDGQIQMHFAHTGQDRLAGARFKPPLQSRIFLNGASQRRPHLGRISLGFGADRHRIQRIGVDR